MVTLRHPAFSKVTREVESECVAGWRAAGWLLDECCGSGPCADCPAPKPEPVEDVRILPVDPPKPAPRRNKPPRSATT